MARGENYYPQWIKSRGVGMEVIAARYTPSGGDKLFWGGQPPVPFTGDPDQFRAVRGAWLRAVGTEPILYLRHRLAVFRCLVLSCTNPYSHFQYETDPRYGKLVDYERMGLLDKIARAKFRGVYLGWAAQTPFAKPPVYIHALLFCLAFIMCVRPAAEEGRSALNRSQIRSVSWALGLGSVSHLALLGFVTPVAIFRYLTPTVFVAVLLAIFSMKVVLGTRIISMASSWPSLVRVAMKEGMGGNNRAN